MVNINYLQNFFFNYFIINVMISYWQVCFKTTPSRSIRQQLDHDKTGTNKNFSSNKYKLVGLYSISTV